MGEIWTAFIKAVHTSVKNTALWKIIMSVCDEDTYRFVYAESVEKGIYKIPYHLCAPNWYCHQRGGFGGYGKHTTVPSIP